MEPRAFRVGLRTVPLVAVARCGYVLVARSLGGNPDAKSRVSRGLLSGTRFVVVGAILKDGGTVRGTATAASIRDTGAIGVAVARDRFKNALSMSAFNFATLRWLAPSKERLSSDAPQREED